MTANPLSPAALPLFAQTTETVWRLTTHWTWAPWVTALFVMAVVALIVVCYRFETTNAGAGYRGVLGVLRLTTVGLILLMLSEAVFSGSKSGKPRLAIVLDRSESMERADVAADTATTRREAASQLLTADEAALLRRLEREYDLQLIATDAGVEWLAEGSEAIVGALSSPTPGDPANLPTDRSATRLGDAIGAALESNHTAPLQGVLALTDGQVTAGRPLSEAAEAARRGGVPLYLLGLGSEEAPPEARLADLVADEVAFVDDLVAFQAKLSIRGLAGRAVRVELFRGGADRPVATQTVTADATGEPTAVRLIDRPSAPGEYRYRLRATIADGSDNLEPSELTHTLRVRDDQIRVLLAAGYPNYEFRYLKQTLERDETVRVATHLQEADPEHAPSDLTALPRFPLRAAELNEYDAIVLIDVDPTLLPRSLWKQVEKFVGERGGGLVMCAGPRSLPAAYRNREAFRALAPTDIGKSSFAGWNESGGYPVAPTELGKQSPPLELGDTPTDSERVWRGLPRLYWRGDVGPAKPAAQVLASHPSQGLASGPAPLIVSQYFGAGRVILHAMDSTWRWRKRVGDVYFARYWVQTLRSLARGKRSETQATLDFAADKRRYEPGEPVRLRLRDRRTAPNREGAPTVILQAAGRADRKVELVESAGGGRFEKTLRDLPAGRYRALLADGGNEPASTEFEVVAPLGEDARPEMNRAGLQAAAERSRGVFLTYDEADDLADAIPPGRPTVLESVPPIELWNRWPLLLGITLCLTAEWVLRKRRAML